MSVKIRLKRFGKRSKPTYRIVAIDESKKRQGREIDIIGSYDPNFNPAKVVINQEKLAKFIGTGAQMSDTVRQLNLKLKK